MDNNNETLNPTPPVTPDVPPTPKVYISQAEQDGLIEIVNADGAKCQVTKEVAAAMVENLEKLKQQLGGTV